MGTMNSTGQVHKAAEKYFIQHGRGMDAQEKAQYSQFAMLLANLHSTSPVVHIFGFRVSRRLVLQWLRLYVTIPMMLVWLMPLCFYNTDLIGLLSKIAQHSLA